ncbi:tetratricopeptide repeat protein [Winogradskyella jejuensis]|uniref:Tetratricopeptide repeat-containing protein n=1 Tax=Winogradskyella jejuensis TaxID=1089305 RepID=A0A1M5SPZ4_9FLAO|nr:tetratricopeptide repeat protein [Winogradskyella jejuensis]SHH40582.1 Tetratricopeptide repeat-containing protein [Winogradskyella jejuensis]
MSIDRILPLFLLSLFFSCDSKKISDKADYQAYLAQNLDTSKIVKEVDFWTLKLNITPNQFPYLLKRASAYTALFNTTGKIDNLINAEKDLLVANNATDYKNTSYLRALAYNYLSQHKFKKALELLKKAENLGEKLENTQKMLFDVNLELGNTIEAQKYLSEFKDFSDFDYLIRLAKWEDHNGNLDGAINYMERATKISESGNTTSLKQWAYTNLADFYGHAGKIDLSYYYYLKALELNPNDAYAKKGIAWIVYSYEKKPDEALSILNQVTSYYNAPDYNLIKAEIAEYKNDIRLKNKAQKEYTDKVDNALYGHMYNKYDVMLYAEELQEPEKAIEIAKQEVNHRPTAQSYDLLAWSYFKAGNIDKAIEIIDAYVTGKTEEPEVLYHIAEIYKAKGRTKEVADLKEGLLASVYELGPLMETKILNL